MTPITTAAVELVVWPSDSGGGGEAGCDSDYELGEVRRDPPPYFRSDRFSDNLICKDKYDTEQWFIGLKALISRGHQRKWRTESRSDGIPSEANSPRTYTRRSSPLNSPFGSGDSLQKNKVQELHKSFIEEAISF
ncbi:uncharacterized protein LOC114315641 isoform X3 [Camellia sinensis]|uniref:uncharacterized protein LOC114315641 isoform X3 n=1 Tax=Camellia sinensis TaxID=4442 RepID=UPI00103655D0|nr:uncharacterized protein LOC114315641 isoform X3 [Camellia sinensis]